MISPPPPYPPSGRHAERALGARILLTVAVVWLFLTGGCTLAFGGFYVADGMEPYGLFFLVAIGFVGLICMTPGLILLAVGLWMRRPARGRRPAD